jgi:hypothetical protein
MSLGYVANDATRTIGQVSDTGEYYEPTAPNPVANVTTISVVSKVAMWVSIIGGVIMIYNYIKRKK